MTGPARSSDRATRPLPSINTYTHLFLDADIFTPFVKLSPSFDKCLEKRSKKFTVTRGDEQTTSALAISNDRSQLAQPKQIAFAVLVCLRAGLWGLPNKPPFGARQPVGTGLDDPRRAGRLAAQNQKAGNRRSTPRRHAPDRRNVFAVHQDSVALRRRPDYNEPLAHRIRH